MLTHHYEIDQDDGRTIVFVCPEPGCGRRVVYRRGHVRSTVIDIGDFFSAHVGAVGPIELGVRLDG